METREDSELRAATLTTGGLRECANPRVPGSGDAFIRRHDKEQEEDEEEAGGADADADAAVAEVLFCEEGGRGRGRGRRGVGLVMAQGSALDFWVSGDDNRICLVFVLSCLKNVCIWSEQTWAPPYATASPLPNRVGAPLAQITWGRKHALALGRFQKEREIKRYHREQNDEFPPSVLVRPGSRC